MAPGRQLTVMVCSSSHRPHVYPRYRGDEPRHVTQYSLQVVLLVLLVCATRMGFERVNQYA